MILLRERPEYSRPKISTDNVANYDYKETYEYLVNFLFHPWNYEDRGIVVNKPRRFGKTQLAIDLVRNVPNTIIVVDNKNAGQHIKSRLGIDYFNKLFYHYDVIHRFLHFDKYNVIFDEQNQHDLDILLENVYPKRWVNLRTPH